MPPGLNPGFSQTVASFEEAVLRRFDRLLALGGIDRPFREQVPWFGVPELDAQPPHRPLPVTFASSPNNPTRFQPTFQLFGDLRTRPAAGAGAVDCGGIVHVVAIEKPMRTGPPAVPGPAENSEFFPASSLPITQILGFYGLDDRVIRPFLVLEITDDIPTIRGVDGCGFLAFEIVR